MGAVLHQFVHAREGGELARGRERSLGFVEDVEAAAEEFFGEQGPEGFAVGHFVERGAAVPGDGVTVFDFGGDVEETFGAEEEAGVGAARPARHDDVAVQRRGAIRACRN